MTPHQPDIIVRTMTDLADLMVLNESSARWLRIVALATDESNVVWI